MSIVQHVLRARSCVVVLAFLGCVTDSEAVGDGQGSEADSAENEQVPRSADVGPTPTEEPAEGEFYNPWMELASVDGPIPFFERTEDELGNRYVIGEGGFVATEDGPYQAIPALQTMTPSPLDPQDLVDPAGNDQVADEERPKISADVATQFAEADGATIPVIITTKHDDPGLQARLAHGMATGSIKTRAEYDQAHDEFIAARQERIASANASIVDMIESSGGIIIAVRKNIGSITASINSTVLTSLDEHESVISVDSGLRVGAPTAGCGAYDATPTLCPFDGLTHQHGTQLRQYVQANITGEGPSSSSSDDLTVAIIELDDDGLGNPASFHTTHGAWRETSPLSAFRYAVGAPTGLWECTSASCDDVAMFSTPADTHATNIAGIILGDMTYPQIPSVYANDRERTSGFAREARAHFYSAAANEDAAINAFDHIMGLPASQHPPHVINNSYRFGYAVNNCDGMSPLAATVNDAFSMGFAVISGAGNDGGSSTECTVGSPGDAIGSFTVGAHLDSSDTGTVSDVRSAGIWTEGSESSAWGGNASDGDNRSLVSITAPARRTYRISQLVGPPPDSADGYYEHSAHIGATSYATAVVTAAALDHMDSRFRDGSTLVDDPGVLYSSLLVMGDRQNGLFLGTSTPNHLWGVGRLRARRFGTAGLHAPMYWASGGTCISANESWSFTPFASNPPADVEVVKAAAFWMRHDHQTINQTPEINLFLRGAGLDLVSDQDAYDNKAYVYYADWPADEPVRIRLVSGLGGFLMHHEPMCGGSAPNHKVFVYYTIFAEDNDRSGAVNCDASEGTGIFAETGTCPNP